MVSGMRRPLRAQLKKFAEGITNRIRPGTVRQRLTHGAQQPMVSRWQPLTHHVAPREMHGVPAMSLPLVARRRLLPPVAETDTEATADAAWAALRALRGTRPRSAQPKAPLSPPRPASVSLAREKAGDTKESPRGPDVSLDSTVAPMPWTAPPTLPPARPTVQRVPKATAPALTHPTAQRTVTRSTVETPTEQPPASEPPAPLPSPVKMGRPEPPPPTTAEQPTVQREPETAAPKVSHPPSKRSGTQRTAESPAEPQRAPESPGPPQPAPRPMPRAETRAKPPSIQRQPALEPPARGQEPASPERIGQEEPLAFTPKVAPLPTGAPEKPPLTEPGPSLPAEPPAQPKPPASPPEPSPPPLPLARHAAPSTHPTLAQPPAPRPAPVSTPLVQSQRFIPPHQPIGRRPVSPPAAYRQPVTLPRVQRAVEAPDTEPAIAPPSSIGEQLQRAEIIPTAAPEPTAESPVMPAPGLEPRQSVRPSHGPAELAQRTVARHRRSVETFGPSTALRTGFAQDETQDRPSRQSQARPIPEVEPEATPLSSPAATSLQRATVWRETTPLPLVPTAPHRTKERPAPTRHFRSPAGEPPSVTSAKTIPASPPVRQPAGEPPFEVPPTVEPTLGPAVAVARPGPVVVQRAVSSTQDLRQALQPMLTHSVVQTAPEVPAAGPAPEAQEEKSEGEGQDIESLAREVYRLVRHRLAIEREREGKRW